MGTRVYAHYNHTDPCKYVRWTARESHEFMYARPWQHVLDYYSNAVRGHASLSKLFAAKPSLVREDNKSKVSYTETQLEDSVRKRERSGRLARVNFKIVLSYHGASFDGWQKQPDLYTVQGVVEKSLGRFVDEKKAQLLKDKSKPLEGCAVVAGRTDKGVSALNQVCSFYTWRKDVRPYEIEDAINLEMPGKLRVVSVSEVSRVFHPNFSAKWRRYFYIFPLDDGIGCGRCSEKEKDLENIVSDKKRDEQTDGYEKCLVDENVEDMISPEESSHEFKEKPSKFSVCKVNQLLRQLEGKLLSYKIFARDTKASRNVGPPTECFMYHARAAEATLPFSDLEEGRKVMCIELVANRFLRKMVRVLVATSIREAAAEAEDDVLIKLMDATCRRATAPPAPPEGLCLFDVGYDEFDPRNSLIS